MLVMRRIGALSVGFGGVIVSGPGTVKSPGGLPSQSLSTREGSGDWARAADAASAAAAQARKRMLGVFMGLPWRQKAAAVAMQSGRWNSWDEFPLARGLPRVLTRFTPP